MAKMDVNIHAVTGDDALCLTKGEQSSDEEHTAVLPWSFIQDCELIPSEGGTTALKLILREVRLRNKSLEEGLQLQAKILRNVDASAGESQTEAGTVTRTDDNISTDCSSLLTISSVSPVVPQPPGTDDHWDQARASLWLTSSDAAGTTDTGQEMAEKCSISSQPRKLPPSISASGKLASRESVTDPDICHQRTGKPGAYAIGGTGQDSLTDMEQATLAKFDPAALHHKQQHDKSKDPFLHKQPPQPPEEKSWLGSATDGDLKPKACSTRSVQLEELIAEDQPTAGAFAVGPNNETSTPEPEDAQEPERDPEQATQETMHNSGSSATLVEATLCQDEEDEEEEAEDERGIRSMDSIGRSCLQEDLVCEAKPLEVVMSHRAALGGIALVLAIIVALILSLLAFRKDATPALAPTEAPSMQPSSVPSMNPTDTPPPTLQRVTERGVLRCGVLSTGIDFFARIKQLVQEGVTLPEKVPLVNFDMRMCDAIAAAALGNDFEVEIVRVEQNTSFAYLMNRSVDVLIPRPSPTMEADVLGDTGSQGIGVTFSDPFLYGGLVFSGLEKFVRCTEDDIKTFDECSDLKICVPDHSQHLEVLSNRIPQRNILKVQSFMDVYLQFMQGACNVIGGQQLMQSWKTIWLFGYTGEWVSGTKLYTNDPWAMATRDSDPEWSQFVNIVFNAQLAAEAANITKLTASAMPDFDLFGEDYRNMLRNAIGTWGNYGEVYDACFEGFVPRSGWNLLNNGTTGLMMALPTFGRIKNEGPGPDDGGILQNVLMRRNLRCGVRPNRPGFADRDYAKFSQNFTSLMGLDVDYCRALASSLFDGDIAALTLVELEDEFDGFSKLSSGFVDVVAGAPWTVDASILEPSTGEGFFLSRPYFYSPNDEVGANFADDLCVAAREGDQQWSSFISTVILATIWAEEQAITQRFSEQMPAVNLFGPELDQMLRNAVHASGNYGEMYDRSLSFLLPRSGRNRLNRVEDPTPQFRYMPGLV